MGILGIVNIYNLAEKQGYVTEVGTLIYNEWSFKVNSDSLNKAITRVGNSLNKNTVPQTFIALSGDVLVGFVSLWDHDGDEHLDLAPWLATLYVKEEYRGLQISKQLNERVISSAQQLNYQKLYLKTNLLNFYKKYGWVKIETMGNGENLYCFNLTSKNKL